MGFYVFALKKKKKKKKKTEITANTATRNLAKLASPWGGGLS